VCAEHVYQLGGASPLHNVMARLRNDKRQKNQLVRAFREDSRSEAPMASKGGTEPFTAKHMTESPAIGEQWMDEVCERENCKQALVRVKSIATYTFGSRRAGERVMKSLTRFIITKLNLKVNEHNSAVGEPWELRFLGFGFTIRQTPKRRSAPKAVCAPRVASENGRPPSLRAHHFRGCYAAADRLRLAGQRAGVGKCHRALRGARLRTHPARR
jgi:hypothetical protein